MGWCTCMTTFSLPPHFVVWFEGVHSLNACAATRHTSKTATFSTRPQALDSIIVGNVLFDLHQLAGLGGWRLRRRRPLRITPKVKDGYLVHARNGAVRRARLLGEILAPHVLPGVLLKRNAGITALLGAVVHQAVLADVEITRPCPAAPLVGTSERNVVLKPVDAGEAAFLERLHLVVHLTLFFETSSGLTLSIEICTHSSPARFSRSIRSGTSR